MNKLIVYFSRADENYFGGRYRYIEVGNTRKVAMMIKDITGADIFELEPKVPYAKDYKTCIAQAKKDLETDARPELVTNIDVSDYDEIYLGYPNYWGTMPMAVYTFLDANDWHGKIIHPFCTHEGSGLGHTTQDIIKTCPEAKVEKGLAICGSDVDDAKVIVKAWLEA